MANVKSESIPGMIRQGDVLLIPVASIPERVKKLRRDKGRLVLEYGEVTGHAHVVDAPDSDAKLFTDEDDQKFLSLMKDAFLVHEEHNAVPLKKGMYRQIRQEEWDDSMERPREIYD